MWGQIAAAAIPAVTGFIGGIQQRGTIKRAGTVIQQQAEDEERRAYARAEEINPRLQEAYLRAQQGIESTAFPQADIVQQRGERAGEEAIGAAREAGGYLDPYRTAGTGATESLASLAAQKAPTAADLEFDPGYQFRLTEGQKALERSRAAKGVLAGGGTAKALTRYAQGAASQEYAAAFDRFMRGQQERRETLTGLASRGLTAGQTAGGYLTQGTQYAGTMGAQGTQFAANTRTGAAEQVGKLGIESTGVQAQNVLNADVIGRGYRDQGTQARANSMIGASNAFWGGMQGLGNFAGEAVSMWDMGRKKYAPGSLPYENTIPGAVDPTAIYGKATGKW